MVCAAMPAACAQAAAASALRTLCSPGMASVTLASPVGVARAISLSRGFNANRPVTSPARMPNSIRLRPPALSLNISAIGSSAFSTATPSAGSASNTLAFSAATASTECMNSRCSRWALFTSATVGHAIAASEAISPGWFMPSSTAQ